MSRCSERGNKLFVEGLINFKSGKTRKTNFVFESKGITKSGKAIFEGYNKEITGANKAFKLTGKIANKSLMSESLSYRYSQNKQRIYGRVFRWKLLIWMKHTLQRILGIR